MLALCFFSRLTVDEAGVASGISPGALKRERGRAGGWLFRETSGNLA
jgi:hypothetical protein